MNDQEYFIEYQKCFEVVFSSQTEDWAYLQDADFKYQAMTNNMLNLLGVESFDLLKNKTAATVAVELKMLASKDTELFTKQYQQIKKNKKRGIYLEVMPYQGEERIFVIYKTPIINPENQNFVGIRGQVTNLLWPHAIKTLLKMHGAKGLLLGHRNNRNSWQEYPLTDMQHMVLFLCLNNYSYSEIAVLLNEFGHEITPVRVNDYLEQLKLIFHVRNKTQLIEKAIGLNFHVFLPEGLFNKLSSVEISNEAAAIISTSQREKA